MSLERSLSELTELTLIPPERRGYEGAVDTQHDTADRWTFML